MAGNGLEFKIEHFHIFRSENSFVLSNKEVVYIEFPLSFHQSEITS